MKLTLLEPSMAYLSTPLSPATTLATMNRVSNAITLGIFVSIVNGMSVRYAKSTAPANLNGVALWVVQSLALPHRRLHPPPNLALFLLHIPDRWSLRTLMSVVTTLALVPPLVLILL